MAAAEVAPVAPPRWLRGVLAASVLGVAGLGAVLAVYSTLGSPWHLGFVAATVGGGLAYLATPWRWPAMKLGAAVVVAAATCFVAWVLASAMVLAAGAQVLLVTAVAVPVWWAALGFWRAGRRVDSGAASIAGVLAVVATTIAVGPVVVFRFIYSYDLDDLEAQAERLRREPGVTILVDASTTGRTDPRSIVNVGDKIVTAFSNSSGIGEKACTLVWPDGVCLHPGLESLTYDPASGRACAVGTERGGHSEGRLFCAPLAGGAVSGVDLPDGLGLASAFDATRRRFHVVHESGHLTEVDADPLAVRSFRSLGLYHPDAAAPVWSADRLVARSSDGFLSSVNLADGSYVRVYLGPLAVGMGIGVSEARGEVYVADMMRPVIRVLDPVTLTEKRRLRVAAGIRPIADLGDSGRIACGGFYNGYLYVVDAESGAGVAKTFVGKLVRALTYDAEHHAVLVGSSAGLLRVELP